MNSSAPVLSRGVAATASDDGGCGVDFEKGTRVACSLYGRGFCCVWSGACWRGRKACCSRADVDGSGNGGGGKGELVVLLAGVGRPLGEIFVLLAATTRSAAALVRLAGIEDSAMIWSAFRDDDWQQVAAGTTLPVESMAAFIGTGIGGIGVSVPGKRREDSN